MKNPEFSIGFDKKANIFVSYAHELGIYSQGRSYEEALMAIQSAVVSYKKVMSERTKQ